MSEKPTIHLTVENGTAVVLLDRPEALNAMTVEMVAAFNQAIDDAVTDPAVRAIVVTGSGRAFCAGLDMASVAEMARSGNRRLAERGIDPERPALFARLREQPKPVIAAVNGMAAGAGLVLALMCDIRIMDKDAALTTSFAKLGLIAEHGTSWLLPRLAGTGQALDILWTARRVGAAEARAMGLVDRIASDRPALDEALAFAAGLAGSAPRAMAEIKEMVYAHQSADFAGALRDADARVTAALAHPDVAEGLAAAREKRVPAFSSVPPID